MIKALEKAVEAFAEEDMKGVSYALIRIQFAYRSIIMGNKIWTSPWVLIVFNSFKWVGNKSILTSTNFFVNGRLDPVQLAGGVILGTPTQVQSNIILIHKMTHNSLLLYKG